MIRNLFVNKCGIAVQALFVGWILVGYSVHGQEPQVLAWTDLSGSYKVEATFVRISGDTVELQDKQGKVLKVPLAKLSLDSQLQAKKLANPKAFEKPVPSANSIAIPADVGPSPFPPNPTIEQFMDIFIKESKAKSSTVVWHAMPKEMQLEVDALVVKGMEVAGTSILTQVRSLLGNVGKIIREKKQFIMAHPQVARNQQVTAALSGTWPEIVAVTDVLTDRSIWAASNFKAGKIGLWFCGLQAKIGPPSEALTKKLIEFAPPGTINIPSGSFDEMQYKVITSSADSAQLELTVAGKPPVNVDFKRVGESWLPVQIADQWQEQFAMARAAMDGLTDEQLKQTRAMAGTTLAAVGGFVGSLANAETQEDFNQVIMQLTALAQQSAGQMPGGARPGGQQPGGQFPGRPSKLGIDGER